MINVAIMKEHLALLLRGRNKCTMTEFNDRIMKKYMKFEENKKILIENKINEVK